jgi:nucleotide-binding universal stress UspA family protein
MNGSGSEQGGSIVVGVDGSEGSRNALRWAARQAGLTGASLEAVIGWEYPAFYGWAAAIPDDLDYDKLAEHALDVAVDEVFGRDRPAWLRTRVVGKHPALALVEASEGAELLVVGSRGHGAFADMLLGSVSTYCVHHVHCPITVIRSAGCRSKDPGPARTPARNWKQWLPEAGSPRQEEGAMTIRVGINGFGRIGRTFVRRALERSDVEVVAVNDITDARTLAYLLEFDSTYGRLGASVTHSDDSIIIDDAPIRVLSSRDPAEIDWGALGVDIVVESTGKFRARDQAALHLKGGARKVLLSAPGKGADLTVVVGSMTGSTTRSGTT